MTLIQDIEPALNPAERRAAEAEAAVTEALAAVRAADDHLEAARAADAAETTAASRSNLARARRQRTAAGDRAIDAEEAFAAELARLDGGEERAAAFERRQDQAEIVELRGRIRSALQTTGTLPGLFAQLAQASALVSVPQVGATTLAALADLTSAARVLAGRLESEGWPRLANNREVPQ